MSKIFGLILLLQLANIALAQDEITLSQVETDTAGYYIKLPYEEVNEKLIVRAVVGGKQRRFIFDTGTVTCISQALANELSLSDKEDIQAVDQSGRIDTIPIVILNKVTFDTTAFRNIPALAFERSIIFDCFNVDGLIGSNLLHKSIVQLSKHDRTIVITNIADSVRLDKKFATKLYLDKEQSSPYFYVKLGKTKLQVLFDSGSNELMAISTDDFYRLEGKNIFKVLGNTYGSSSIGMFGVAENVEMYRLFLSRFMLGKTKLANAIVHTTEGGSRIGIKLLSYGKITIDYINKQLYFEPNDTDLPYISVRERFWSVSPSLEDGMLIVGTVWDDLGQHINRGDRIVAIDGVSYRKRSDCDILLKPLIDRRKNEALLTIENKDGVRRNVKIIK